MVRHLPSSPWTMLASTAWVWSCGSRIARGVVAESGGDDLLAAGVDHTPGLRVLDPGLDDVPFEPGEGVLHRLVVRGGDALVATDQGREGDGLGCGEGKVAPGPVMDVAFPIPAPKPASGSVRDLSRQHVLERLRIDGSFEAKRLGAPAGPGAGVPVRGIVLGVVAVA